jgi:hypothetical protein
VSPVAAHQLRHCERSEAIQSRALDASLDWFVAARLAMTMETI